MTTRNTSESTRIETLLDQLIRVTAATAVHGRGLSQGAPFLDRLGVDRGVIAAIYDTSESSVRGAISKARGDKSVKKSKDAGSS
jgi:hypothetical protein